PELRIRGSTVEFEKVPTMIRVRASLSKTRLPYFTFLCSEGCTYLKEYLESRLMVGEELTPESPLIAPGERRVNATRKFLWSTKVGAILRGSRRAGKGGPTGIRGAGFDWRPYVLRAYADTALDIAESKGLISHPWRQFFMGHKGDIEARYSTNKGRLPPDMVEEMRAAYKRCEPYLQTISQGREEDPELTTLRTMVESGVLDLSKPNVRNYLIQKLGIEDAEVRVARMRESGLDEHTAFARIVCEELGIEPMRIEASKPESNDDPKRVISEDELERYLAEGWDVQTVLPSGRILIRKG
ncbi:hypothetical protein KEJ49_08000, partial [Candidatus Bathyarchaeota archaeon]|nr:hypothetical protein [Candidatus Bathyarchaeota archaeon]